MAMGNSRFLYNRKYCPSTYIYTNGRCSIAIFVFQSVNHDIFVFAVSLDIFCAFLIVEITWIKGNPTVPISLLSAKKSSPRQFRRRLFACLTNTIVVSWQGAVHVPNKCVVKNSQQLTKTTASLFNHVKSL